MATGKEEYDSSSDKLGLDHRPSAASSMAGANLILEKKGLNRKLMLASLISYIASFSFGYNNAIIGSTLGQANFYAYFPQLVTASNATSLIGAIVALISAGGAFGVVINAIVNDKYGRRTGFFTCGLLTVLGCALISGAVNLTMLCIGRTVQGLGAWGAMNVACVYVQELAPSGYRGEFGSGLGPALIVGYVLAAWVQVAFFYVGIDSNWRLPLAFGGIGGIIMCIVVFMVPESPRWLIWQGRTDEALKILKTFHEDKTDPDHILAREEHFQICKQVELDKTKPSGWMLMFTKYRRQSWAATLTAFNNQISGIQVVTNYGVTIYAAAGLTGGMPLIINAIWLMWATCGSAFWSSQVDRIGRKPLFVWNSILTGLTFAIIIGLYAEYVDNAANASNLKAGQSALIFSFFPYVFFYEMAEPTTLLYCGEIFPLFMRAKGVAICLVSLNVTATWVTMTFPDGIAAGQWRFLLLYLCLLFICAGLQQYFLRESRNVPLEEMPAVWGQAEDVAIFSKDIKLSMIRDTEEPRHV